MWNETEVTKRLNIRYPIIQGPFGGGLSSTTLVAAVSNAGGLGSFGAHHLTPAQLRDVATAIRTLTTHPFAMNLWVGDHDSNGHQISQEEFDANLARLRPYYQELGIPEPSYPERFGQRFDEQIEALLEVRPPVFSFVFGIPPRSVLEECRRRGIRTIGTVTTIAEAQLLDEAQVDLIVASGFEAGGHRASFVKSPEESLTGTFALIPKVVDRVHTPVVAAGGIADGRGVAAALALGAQGVQIGTAFLACEESNVSPAHRDKLFSPDADNTALTRVYSGRLARGIRNRFMDEMAPYVQDLPPYPSQGWFTGQFKKAALEQGRSDVISLWAGQAAPLLRDRNAATLLEHLVAETTMLLTKLGRN
jgi:nitronate monooxygenase